LNNAKSALAAELEGARGEVARLSAALQAELGVVAALRAEADGLSKQVEGLQVRGRWKPRRADG